MIPVLGLEWKVYDKSFVVVWLTKTLLVWHTNGFNDLKGCGLAIAYESDVSKIQPEVSLLVIPYLKLI
jgi:hypothetical protein